MVLCVVCGIICRRTGLLAWSTHTSLISLASMWKFHKQVKDYLFNLMYLGCSFLGGFRNSIIDLQPSWPLGIKSSQRRLIHLNLKLHILSESTVQDNKTKIAYFCCLEVYNVTEWFLYHNFWMVPTGTF